MKKLFLLITASFLITSLYAQDWQGEYNIRMQVKNNFVGKQHFTMGTIRIYKTNGETRATISFADPRNGAIFGGNIKINSSLSVIKGTNQPDTSPAHHVQHTYRFYKEGGKVKGYWQILRLNPQNGNYELHFNVEF